MNMNDREWNDLWDNEPDEDDDYNDAGGDIDRNNDETFDNAAEWNEDEHEELIARDSILSHSISRNNNSLNSRSGNSNSTRTNNNNNTSSSSGYNNNININNANRSDYVSNIIGSAGRSGWNSVADKDLFPALERQSQSTSFEAPWHAIHDASVHLQLLQQLQNPELLIQKKLQEQERHKQQLRDMHLLRQHQDQQRAETRPQPEMGRKVLRVDELERQLLETRINQGSSNETNQSEVPKRSGWSPFGGKDLFNTPDQNPHVQMDTRQNILMQGRLESLSLEQQQRILMQQQHILQQHQLQRMAVLKQQQIHQEQKLMSQNPQCFTVEELEKQMISNRSNNNREQTEPRKSTNHMAPDTTPKSTKPNDKRDMYSNTHDRRDGERHERRDRFDRHDREVKDGREYRNRKEHRNHRDDWRNRPGNREYTIIPPQVQLSVIDKAKRRHKSLNAMQSDEFLQDRMPNSDEGFLFKRHSKILKDKMIHDGVLTESERNWLTRIQEKIQADYDDNLDQDYYYLLYFNRSSMTDEAVQKPCGPGVLDRRFIPRERLLYNSSN